MINLKKIIFLEGLPGVGKTTILNTIKSMKLKNVYLVDEIINKNILRNISCTELDFIANDELKLNAYSEGIIIIDRGPISTLSYSQTKNIINYNYNYNIETTLEFFKKNRKYFLKNSKVIYLTNKGTNYSITVADEKSPYGTVENQKLLEEISIFNCKKYCKNFVIKEYYKENMEEIINEIIS